MLKIGFDASGRPQLSRNGEPKFTSSHRFSEKIMAQGGPQRDTSIKAASNAMRRTKMTQAKANKKIEKLEETFDSTAATVNKLCDDIEAMRKIMAQRLLQWYSALAIQCFVRCYFARKAKRTKKSIRLLSWFIYFKTYFKRRVQATNLIIDAFKKYRSKRQFIIVMRKHRSAKKIQRWFKHCRSRYIMFSKLHFMRIVKRTFDHVMLFGTRRAWWAEVMVRNPDFYAAHSRPLLTFFLKCIHKRRMRILTGPQGKLAFYVLAHYCEGYKAGKNNMVISYIRRRLGTDNKRNSISGTVAILQEMQREEERQRANSSNQNSSANLSNANITSKDAVPFTPALPAALTTSSSRSSQRKVGASLVKAATTSSKQQPKKSSNAGKAHPNVNSSNSNSNSKNSASSNGGTSSVQNNNSTSAVVVATGATGTSPNGKSGGTATAASQGNSTSGSAAASPGSSANNSAVSTPQRKVRGQGMANILPGSSLGALISSSNFSEADLPTVLKGFYRIRTFADAVILIRDLQKLAKRFPSFLDDHLPPSTTTRTSIHQQHPRRSKPLSTSTDASPSVASNHNISPQRHASRGDLTGSIKSHSNSVSLPSPERSLSVRSSFTRTSSSSSSAAAMIAAAAAAAVAAVTGNSSGGSPEPQPPSSGDPSAAAPRSQLLRRPSLLMRKASSSAVLTEEDPYSTPGETVTASVGNDSRLSIRTSPSNREAPKYTAAKEISPTPHPPANAPGESAGKLPRRNSRFSMTSGTAKSPSFSSLLSTEAESGSNALGGNLVASSDSVPFSQLRFGTAATTASRQSDAQFESLLAGHRAHSLTGRQTSFSSDQVEAPQVEPPQSSIPHHQVAPSSGTSLKQKGPSSSSSSSSPSSSFTRDRPDVRGGGHRAPSPQEPVHPRPHHPAISMSSTIASISSPFPFLSSDTLLHSTKAMSTFALSASNSDESLNFDIPEADMALLLGESGASDSFSLLPLTPVLDNSSGVDEADMFAALADESLLSTSHFALSHAERDADEPATNPSTYAF